MKLWLLLVFSLSPAGAFAAACCGGGFAAPAIIAGDDLAQFTSSYSFQEVSVDNVDSQGIWRKWDAHQAVQIFRLEGAHLISDRWQVGASLPIVQRTRLQETYAGLGDVAGSLGYEYLPDWDYNPYRPKGLGYLQITAPTGKARADSKVGGLDSRGNGFWALGLGTLLTKTVGVVDLFTTLEAHRSLPRATHDSPLAGELVPGYGGNFGFGAGYNFSSWRLGAALTWSYEDPVALRGIYAGAVERYATAALSASYLASNEWAGTVSYLDQTKFGHPVNTSLGRGASLQLQRKWLR